MNIYQFDVERVNGETLSLSQYKGKVLLIVNTASKCKFTSQFEDLQKLYEEFRDQNFEILGFLCNQFAGQEPGSSIEAAEFCQSTYGVSFPMFGKVNVNGEDAHPLFKYLKEQQPFRGFNENIIQEKLLKLMVLEKTPEWYIGDELKWNFTKFLVDQKGNVVRRYEPTDDIFNIKEDVQRLIRYQNDSAIVS
ncbi:glutathione peroxidase [Fervidibacillus halotolerans]|uniref:Glutathione peroxidase n=1 Tax=Fervidibacillus halotolerans TaxID=2980027 RepID=A0A9E8RZ06_9BACI|nr:glutathione peroxidase [Fervidibacillus halotolerans]WAA12813.1 glutathione peroxidase [Fervidibacillus halotolerans]